MMGAPLRKPSRRAAWHHLAVSIPLRRNQARRGSPRLSDEPAIAQLMAIDAWLKEHHIPQLLFDPFGAPRSEQVHVFFPVNQPSKALAFRMLCNKLGLAETVDQARVVVPACTRTTPPQLDSKQPGL